MCTVSIIPLTGSRRGYRLVTNRDESRTRPPGEPPQWRQLRASVRAVWPIDALAGGTWVAATDRGLALAILNMNAPGLPVPPTHRQRTRGELIPLLIEHQDAAAALAALAERTLEYYAPFRMVAVSPRINAWPRIHEAAWDGRRLALRAHPEPWGCFVSSGLGDREVSDRLALFDAMVRTAADPVSAQDEYHQHRWPERPEVSVLMQRDEARTVSITTLAVRRSEPPLSTVDPPFEVSPFYLPVPDEPPIVRVRPTDAPRAQRHVR